MLSIKSPNNDKLNAIISDLEDQIKTESDYNETYLKQIDALEKLYKLRAGHKPTKTELRDWIPLMASIGSILVIVLFESFGNTMTSKALSFVGKPKA